jgi:hypothetical protein
MWRRVGILLTDVSEERIASIFRVHRSWIYSTLKMEVIRSSQTSVNKIPPRRHIPEDGILYRVVTLSWIYLQGPGSTQTLAEMSTRNFPEGKGRLARKVDNLTATCELIV